MGLYFILPSALCRHSESIQYIKMSFYGLLLLATTGLYPIE